MDLEMLKPWNWFKYEDEATTQIPVSRNNFNQREQHGLSSLSAAKNKPVDSFMRVQEEFDRLFDEVLRPSGTAAILPRRQENSLSSRFMDNSLLGNYRANLDIAGSDNEYELTIELPGISQDDINIELNNNTLTIKGQKEEEVERKDKHYYCAERSIGAFQRTLSLPDDADKNGLSANINNGLLVIKIPRKLLPNQEVKRIEITSN